MTKDEIKEEEDLVHRVKVEDSLMSSSEHQDQLHHQTIKTEPHNGVQIKDEPDYMKEEQMHEVPFSPIDVKREQSLKSESVTENSSDSDTDSDSNSKHRAKKCRKTESNEDKRQVEASFSKNAEENQNAPSRDEHECSECGKIFRYNSDLKRHMTTHSGNRPFSCTVCDKTFTRKIHLTSHTFTHTGQKPFSCPLCKRGFADKRSLVNHVGEYKEDVELITTHKRRQDEEGKFCCSECGAEFSRNQHLLRHMQIHGGERPHRCTLCKKGFLRKEHLRSHMKTHVCSVCKKRFRNRREMKTHVNRHHSDV